MNEKKEGSERSREDFSPRMSRSFGLYSQEIGVKGMPLSISDSQDPTRIVRIGLISDAPNEFVKESDELDWVTLRTVAVIWSV